VARWLVDGMNVIGSRPDGWWRDRTGAMRTLVERLERFAAERSEEVAVVLDGRPRELGPAGRVEVAFAERRGPNAADDAIAERVAADPAPAELRVVTSDRALADAARGAGAVVVPAESFRTRIEGG
jgi:predicted RNA-binding protein with PIN domain